MIGPSSASPAAPAAAKMLRAAYGPYADELRPQPFGDAYLARVVFPIGERAAA